MSQIPLLVAAQPLTKSLSMCCLPMHHRLTLAGEELSVAVKALENAPEGVEPQLGYWESKFYFLIRIEFLDGRGPQTLAVNRRSAANFLRKHSAREIHDVALDFLREIRSNEENYLRVKTIFDANEKALSRQDFNDIVALAAELKLEVSKVATCFCQIAENEPSTVTSTDRYLDLKRKIVLQILRTSVPPESRDDLQDLDPHVDTILRHISFCNLTCEQIAIQVVKALTLLPHLTAKRTRTQDCLTFDELVKTLLYVETHHKEWDKKLQDSKDYLPLRISSKTGQGRLPRSIIYFRKDTEESGKVLLLFNQHSIKMGHLDLTKTDALVEQGARSRVKEAIDVNTGKPYVIAVQEYTAAAWREFETHYSQQKTDTSEVLGCVAWESIDKSNLRRVTKFGVIMVPPRNSLQIQ